MLMCREIPWEYEEEMKKVQAVLTRSSLYLRIEEDENGWGGRGEICGRKQKRHSIRRDISRHTGVWRQRQKIPRERCFFIESKVCEGVFHRISSGTTRDGLEVFGKMEKGYLLSVDSNWDMYGDGYLSGHYFSEGALREQLEKAYPGLVFTEEPVENQINMYKRDKVGHILFLTVGNKTISGEKFRQLLELPSSNFTMQAADGKIRFLCKGQGHGLGLSQYGGNVLAKEGKSYKEILRYYFPECGVQKKDS